MKIYALFFAFFPFILLAQDAFPKKSITVHHTTADLVIDGILDEEAWSRITPSSDFWQYFPTDSLLAEAQTEIYMMADELNLYVGIKCYGKGNDWLVPSLKRDYRAGGHDNITLVFDSFDDNTNALFFGINPEGVIREGVITNGGNEFSDFSGSWDNKWRGEAQKFDGFYSAELEIPFTTLRYNAENNKWGFLSYRFDTQTNETSVWNRIPRNQTLFSLAYTGPMIWEKPLTNSKKNVSVIPFITGGMTKDYEERGPAGSTGDVGGDIKVGITSGLNLDVTINPDFSQVEVDRQITNLDRFELFFPERRQFFIENADLFGNFGFSNINPFFSRRIGVGSDASTGTTVQNRILGGLRLSGKLDKNTRIGLLNMQTAQKEDQGLPGINYSVGVVQRKIWDRSNFGFIFVNKQAFGAEVVTQNLDPYNRLAGFDFNYASGDNTWSGKTFLHTTISPHENAKLAHGTKVNYNTRSFGVEWTHEIVQDDYNAEVGFVRRQNYIRIEPEVEWKFYPQNDFVNDYSFSISSEVFYRPSFGKTDHSLSLQFDGQLANSSRFLFTLNQEYVYLFDEFDPTGTDSTPLPGHTSYNYVNFRGFINTDQRKVVSASFRPYLGGYFNGWRTGIAGDIGIRYQPKGSIELNYSWNIFNMPHIESTQQTLLIGPRIDYTFSKSLFATAFIQYNTQAKNTNINTRIQWRFAPVSDFFLVITDNYFTGNPDMPEDRFAVTIKNRAIIAKLTYWINV